MTRTPSSASAAAGEPTVAASLAQHAIRLRRSASTPQIQALARRAFLDWLGVALGGSIERPAQALLFGLAPSTGPSRVVGLDRECPVSVAAMINGTAAHTLELDDIYAPGLFHPGAPIIAAALAVADQIDTTVGRLWRAIVVGYEVGCRVATDLGAAHYRSWHTTGTAGAIGAAAAAADLHGADQTTTMHALSLAATMCGGLQQTFRSDAAGKPLHAGAAAQAGVVAAAAALGGVTGAADVFEGQAGLAAATDSATDWAASRRAGGLLAIDRVSVKPYPCCGHAFAAIDGALVLRAGGLRAAEIERVTVASYAAALTVAGLTAPQSDSERRFSIAHQVAAALVHGRGQMFGPQAADDPAVRALRDRVELVVDAGYEARFPDRRGARLVVERKTGQPLEIDVPDRSGSPENPLDDRQVAAKFVSTALTVLGDAAPGRLAHITAIDRGSRVSQLLVGSAVQLASLGQLDPGSGAPTT